MDWANAPIIYNDGKVSKSILFGAVRRERKGGRSKLRFDEVVKDIKCKIFQGPGINF